MFNPIMENISIEYCTSDSLNQKANYLIRAGFWMAGPNFEENLKMVEAMRDAAEKKLSEMKLLMEL